MTLTGRPVTSIIKPWLYCAGCDSLKCMSEMKYRLRCRGFMLMTGKRHVLGRGKGHLSAAGPQYRFIIFLLIVLGAYTFLLKVFQKLAEIVQLPVFLPIALITLLFFIGVAARCIPTPSSVPCGGYAGSSSTWRRRCQRFPATAGFGRSHAERSGQGRQPAV